MINFPCQCGFKFSVPTDLAGTDLQCPECKRLVDVPLLGELGAVNPDGTYRIDTKPELDPQLLPSLMQAFNRNTFDFSGNEKDLRTTFNDIAIKDSNDHAEEGQILRRSPKYDPETGELLVPLEVAPKEEPIEFAHIAGQENKAPVISYASMEKTQFPSFERVFLQVLCFPNWIVLAFIVLFHIICQVLMSMLGMMFPLVPLALVAMAIVAHYPCIVLATGPECMDELPRPLGDLSLSDDLWHPFFRLSFAFALCYWPVFMVTNWMDPGPISLFLAGGTFMAGSIFYPAVLLTSLCSNTVSDFSPRKLLLTIRTIGSKYVILIIEWIVVALIYTVYIQKGLMQSLRLLILLPKLDLVSNLVLMIAAIYTAHVFHWHLGIVYRIHNVNFPWAYNELKPRGFRDAKGRSRPGRISHPPVSKSEAGKIYLAKKLEPPEPPPRNNFGDW